MKNRKTFLRVAFSICVALSLAFYFAGCSDKDDQDYIPIYTATGTVTDTGTGPGTGTGTGTGPGTGTGTGTGVWTGNALIVNHNAVQQFDQIPDYWLDQAKQLAVNYGHTSHGSQVVCGLNWLELYVDPIKYKFKADMEYSYPCTLPAQESPPALRMAELGAHPEDYWEGATAQNATIAELSTGSYDISGWSWCGEHGDTARVLDYIDSMMILEAACPGVTFYYMTGASSPYRVANNDLIRQHCIDNDRILFDFADIEQHDPDGVFQPGYDGTGAWGATWVANNPGVYTPIPPNVGVGGGGDGWLSCSHAHGLFAIMKGQAFWYLMARIAGWDGL